MIISALIVAVLAQVQIPATTLAPSSEERVVFTHAGYTYAVGKISGQVLVLGEKSPDVKPDGGDHKPPPPTPNAYEGVRFFTLIVDPQSPTQAAWRTSDKLKPVLESKGMRFYSYISTESDTATLGFKALVDSIGLPLLVIQKENGQLIASRKVATLAELETIASEAKP